MKTLFCRHRLAAGRRGVSGRIVPALAAIAVAALSFSLDSSVFAAQPGGSGEAPEVGVVTVETEDVTITQELNGRVTPYLIAEVRPQVNGIILKRLFEEGADVQENMPLYQIDPAMYEAELMRAQATLSKARANVAVANAKLERYKRLIDAKAVNLQEYDEVEAAGLQAEAEVGIAEAQVRVARINFDYAMVRSPISGRIGKSSVTQGALVTASQGNALATVQRLDPIYVDVAQPAGWIQSMDDGFQAGLFQNTGASHGKVTLVLDNGKVYEHQGKILFADVTVDQTTGSINLRAEFPNPDFQLLPGMYVRALLDMAKKADAVTVPQRALFRDPDGSAWVMVVGTDGTVEKRKVVTVRAIENKWLLSSGLQGGERVVVDGSQRVRFLPGAPAPKVTPVEVRDAGVATASAR